jgi:hypothetical protein
MAAEGHFAPQRVTPLVQLLLYPVGGRSFTKELDEAHPRLYPALTTFSQALMYNAVTRGSHPAAHRQGPLPPVQPLMSSNVAPPPHQIQPAPNAPSSQRNGRREEMCLLPVSHVEHGLHHHEVDLAQVLAALMEARLDHLTLLIL